MRASFLATFLTACALSLSVSAHGASLSLIPSAQMGLVGETLTLNVIGDFGGDGTLGGGFDIFYDASLLGFVAFEFDAGLDDDLAFRREPDLLSGELNGIGFGEFDGYTGTFMIGAVTFEVLGAGLTDVALMVNEGGPPDNPGPFVNLAGFVIDDLTTAGAQLNLQVPLPAAAWLLLSALLAAFGAGRRA